MINSVYDSSKSDFINSTQYRQITPDRNVQNNFQGGNIEFNFELNQNEYFKPNEGFFRLRCELTKSDGSQLLESDNIAPSFNLGNNLFESCSFHYNGVKVSELSNYVSQISSIKNRLDKSGINLNTVQKSINYFEEDFYKRKSDISSDGELNTINKTEQVSTSRDDLDIINTQTISYTNATRILTFVAPATVVRDYFKIGDYIQFPVAFNGLPANTNVLITDFTANANELVLDFNAIGADVGAAIFDFSRIRSGEKSNRNSSFEIIFNLPLGALNIDSLLGIGNYSIKLQVNPNFQLYAIQSIDSNKTANTDFIFNVVDFYYYVNIIDSKQKLKDGVYEYMLYETDCSASKVLTTAFSSSLFDVNSNTCGLTIAYSDLRSNGADTRASPSLLKVNNLDFTNDSQELNLQRFSVNYRGVNKPNPDSLPEFTSSKDYTTKVYYDSIVYSDKLLSQGGCETLKEFQDRGLYYHFDWDKQKDDISTSVKVYNKFENETDISNMQVMLFDHYKQKLIVTIKNSQVSNVQVI